jgi:hypothetical protein
MEAASSSGIIHRGTVWSSSMMQDAEQRADADPAMGNGQWAMGIDGRWERRCGLARCGYGPPSGSGGYG